MTIKLTPEKKTAFCAALAETGVVAKACKAIEITRQTAYDWRDEDPEFADRWARALKIGVTALEDEAHRRAFDGCEEPVFHKGEVCGSVQKYSDTLAIFLLKAHAPEKYRENSHLQISGHLSLNEMSEEDMRAELAQLAAAGILPTGTDDCDDEQPARTWVDKPSEDDGSDLV